METPFSVSLFKHRSQFKSYYVVWKQKIRGFEPSTFEMFKSYYVVWKLKNISLYNNAYGGLNRTMQYGNTNCLTAIYVHDNSFKSYYVVWKLLWQKKLL